LPKYSPLAVFAFSVALLLFNISRPPMMFDESFYVGAAREFLAAQPSSNAQHPPLGKYFIALSIRTLGDRPLGWRFPSTLAGGLAALALFGIVFRLTHNRRTATIAWLLTMAGGFWFVMGRMADLSIYELAFEVTGIWLFLIAAEKSTLKTFAWSGMLFGLSIGSRWAGVIGLVVCVATALFERLPVKAILAMLAAAFVTYVVAWVPLLIREGRPISHLVAANLYILQFHRHAPADPRLGEPWWTWIFRLEAKQSLAHLVANPVIGWLGLLAVLFLLISRTGKHCIIPLLYLAHLGMWVVGVRPITFFYYYFEAFSFLPPALAISLQGVHWKKIRADVVVTAAALLFFFYWYPTWADLPKPFDLLTGAH
jgi:predicted membrane-bound dolichyl-phosphate-mannose-protein mannosyltransferase